MQGEHRVKLRRQIIFAAIFAGLLAASTFACAGTRGTIGAILGQGAGGRLFVREVPPNLAAAKAGLEPGDEVLLIEGRDVRTLRPEDIHRLLGGEVGSRIRLTLVRGEEVLRVTLVRTPAPPRRKAH